MRKSLQNGLTIISLLANTHYGLTREEICDELGLQRVSFFRYLRALRAVGIQITSQIEPERHGWHKIYRLRTLWGKPFTLTSRAN